MQCSLRLDKDSFYQHTLACMLTPVMGGGTLTTARPSLLCFLPHPRTSTLTHVALDNYVGTFYSLQQLPICSVAWPRSYRRCCNVPELYRGQGQGRHGAP